jgi:hypothetical protein
MDLVHTDPTLTISGHVRQHIEYGSAPSSSTSTSLKLSVGGLGYDSVCSCVMVLCGPSGGVVRHESIPVVFSFS